MIISVSQGVFLNISIRYSVCSNGIVCILFDNITVCDFSVIFNNSVFNGYGRTCCCVCKYNTPIYDYDCHIHKAHTFLHSTNCMTDRTKPLDDNVIAEKYNMLYRIDVSSLEYTQYDTFTKLKDMIEGVEHVHDCKLLSMCIPNSSLLYNVLWNYANNTECNLSSNVSMLYTGYILLEVQSILDNGNTRLATIFHTRCIKPRHMNIYKHNTNNNQCVILCNDDIGKHTTNVVLCAKMVDTLISLDVNTLLHEYAGIGNPNADSVIGSIYEHNTIKPVWVSDKMYRCIRTFVFYSIVHRGASVTELQDTIRMFYERNNSVMIIHVLIVYIISMYLSGIYSSASEQLIHKFSVTSVALVNTKISNMNSIHRIPRDMLNKRGITHAIGLSNGILSNRFSLTDRRLLSFSYDMKMLHNCENATVCLPVVFYVMYHNDVHSNDVQYSIDGNSVLECSVSTPFSMDGISKISISLLERLADKCCKCVTSCDRKYGTKQYLVKLDFDYIRLNSYMVYLF